MRVSSFFIAKISSGAFGACKILPKYLSSCSPRLVEKTSCIYIRLIVTTFSPHFFFFRENGPYSGVFDPNVNLLKPAIAFLEPANCRCRPSGGVAGFRDRARDVVLYDVIALSESAR